MWCDNFNSYKSNAKNTKIFKQKVWQIAPVYPNIQLENQVVNFYIGIRNFHIQLNSICIKFSNSLYIVLFGRWFCFYYSYRKRFEEYETLYNAFHGVAGETKSSSQMTTLSPDDRAQARLYASVLRARRSSERWMMRIRAH